MGLQCLDAGLSRHDHIIRGYLKVPYQADIVINTRRITLRA
jgi:hypothetical protein